MKNSIKTTEVAREYFNETAVYLLETIALKSSNISCSSQARMMLESNDLQTIKHIACGQGSFMSACQRGDIMKAIRLADSSNAEALEGLVDHVINKI